MSGELPSDILEELRKIAGAYMAQERPDHTLQPTALVNEAYLRLADTTRSQWASRKHFLAAAARTMRRILVDHARTRGRDKRGGGWDRVPLESAMKALAVPDLELLGLDEAITQLSAIHERSARVVEWRFFAGLTIPEIADVVGISARTVEDDWYMARAWLRDHLSEAN